MLKPVRTPIPLPSLGAPRRTPKPAPAEGKACAPKGLSGSSCELIAMKLQEEEKTNPNRRKVLERVVVPQVHVPQFHHWGVVRPYGEGPEGFFCLAKDRFRVRVEGWRHDEIQLAKDWEFTDPDDCNGEIVIAVWSKRTPSRTLWGPAPRESGHEHTYWIEYFGPNTGSLIRRAGPFGCTGDPVDHAKEDAGFSEPGVDGGYIILDSEDNVIQTGGMG